MADAIWYKVTVNKVLQLFKFGDVGGWHILYFSPSLPESLTDTNNNQMKLLYLNSSYGLKESPQWKVRLPSVSQIWIKFLNEGGKSILLYFFYI